MWLVCMHDHLLTVHGDVHTQTVSCLDRCDLLHLPLYHNAYSNNIIAAISGNFSYFSFCPLPRAAIVHTSFNFVVDIILSVNCRC